MDGAIVATILADYDDRTGDSGMGTGSAQYGDASEWKRAIQCPPPGMSTL